MKRAVKYSAISIYDFPRNNYSVYWEYAVMDDPAGRWGWWLRFIEYATGRVVLSESGECPDEESGRKLVQEKIVANIGPYRREVPLEEVTLEKAQLLRDKFDECRKVVTTDADPKKVAQAFAGIDQIRGMLRANGYALQEQESIGYEGETPLIHGEG